MLTSHSVSLGTAHFVGTCNQLDLTCPSIFARLLSIISSLPSLLQTLTSLHASTPTSPSSVLLFFWSSSFSPLPSFMIWGSGTWEDGRMEDWVWTVCLLVTSLILGQTDAQGQTNDTNSRYESRFLACAQVWSRFLSPHL